MWRAKIQHVVHAAVLSDSLDVDILFYDDEDESRVFSKSYSLKASNVLNMKEFKSFLADELAKMEELDGLRKELAAHTDEEVVLIEAKEPIPGGDSK